MKTYPTKNIRNILLLGHGGSGKTTLTEALAFNGGAIDRMGRVDEGNTLSDFDPRLKWARSLSRTSWTAAWILSPVSRWKGRPEDVSNPE